MKQRERRKIELICSIAELSGLFHGEKGTKRFLEKVVKTVSRHMKSEVCSVYLYDEKRKKLNLVSTEGLNRDLTGNLTLSFGEGLVGTTMKEMRTILEADGTLHPRFKSIENSFEENFKAFLAVPIMRGLNRIGVLVLQHSQKGYFDSTDARALEAIAGQLAATLENARLLMDISRKEQEANQPGETESRLFKGKKVVAGVSQGQIFYMDDSHKEGHLSPEDQKLYRDGIDAFREAVKKAECQLLELQEKMNEELSDIASMIFSAHLLMLQDEAFSGQMAKLIEEDNLPPCLAVEQVVNSYVEIFTASDNSRLQEKVQDVRDLGHRILRNLSHKEQQPGNYRNQIIIAGDLLPSELLKLTAQKAEGIVLMGGGASAHISILAKSLAVPLIYLEDEDVLTLPEYTDAILDANQGNLIILPDEETIEHYEKQSRTARELKEMGASVLDQTHTADGTRIFLRAAINLLNDVKAAREIKAEGVGLYRSEFPFLIRSDFPSEEEQYRVYKKVFDGMEEGHPITLRTLDVGGDKILSYMPENQGENPFLGLRAIRFLLQNKKVFVGQLKAMLRAGEGRDLRIMFPLVSSVDDYRAAVRMVKKSMEFLDRDGFSYNKYPKLGMMIELPSAVMLIDQLTAEADFLSIGTNDLVQYLLGVDRTNSSVASFYQGEHPAVLRAVKTVVDGALKNDCAYSICGNLTNEKHMIYFFLGVGVRSITIEPHRLPELQEFISKIDLKKAREDSEKILTFSTVEEVKNYLKEVLPN
ncbi:MAG: phosphoenolpyruvate--protein phosphotransferase [Spirochaetales bacterium]|nr:phosphoenolpyruvate--protein phosphotransferase [Spirochaetales bacterium]